MDNLTHGLFGLAIGALRRPRRTQDEVADRQTDRAVVWACVVAAELPDLDALWPAESSVLHALQAHRGWTHSLIAAPLVAALAVGAVKLFHRRARVSPMFAFALPSVLVAHLLCDAWTGWGTRLFLPFSDTRATLDWTLVLDPLVTMPMLIGAAVAWWRRPRWRRAVLVAAAVSSLYIAHRAVVRQLLLRQVGHEFASARRVEVFPSPFHPWRWRFVVDDGERWTAGSTALGGEAVIERQYPRAQPSLPPPVAASRTVQEALQWARMPLVSYEARAEGHLVRVADLRYHWSGKPTLTFHIELDVAGRVTESRLDRDIR